MKKHAVLLGLAWMLAMGASSQSPAQKPVVIKKMPDTAAQAAKADARLVNLKKVTADTSGKKGATQVFPGSPLRKKKRAHHK